MYTNKDIPYFLGMFREAGVIRARWVGRGLPVCEEEDLVRGRVSCGRSCMSEGLKPRNLTHRKMWRHVCLKRCAQPEKLWEHVSKGKRVACLVTNSAGVISSCSWFLKRFGATVDFWERKWLMEGRKEVEEAAEDEKSKGPWGSPGTGERILPSYPPPCVTLCPLSLTSCSLATFLGE